MPLLTEASARQALITEYFNQYGKTLSANARLIGHTSNGEPIVFTDYFIRIADIWSL
ncbi:MAG: hypothetical protein ABFS56_28075 [Pseudomonadota bacterium]